MSSVGSQIATVPTYSKTLVCLATTSNITSLPTAATSNVSGVVGSQILFNTVANAAAGITYAGNFASGAQLRDMGARVHVYGNGQHVYTLTSVQNHSAAAAEGAGGAGPAYNTAYIVTWSADPKNISGVETLPITVARVGGN